MSRFESEKMKQGAQYQRAFIIESREVDEENRSVELAFSSEEPFERFFGVEVLDHSKKSVRLDRLNNGAAVLVQHDLNDQVGVVESARIDSDRRGRATIRFSRSARGQEIFDDVKDEIRKKVSVGYFVHKFEVEEKKGEAASYRALDWEPFEVSLVSVPADDSVGVGRSIEEKVMSEEIKVVKDDAPAEVVKPAVPKFDREATVNEIRSAELKRMNWIREMAEDHGFEELGLKAVDAGTTVDAFHKELLKEIGIRNNDVRKAEKSAVDLGLSEKEANQFSLIRLMDALSRPNDPACQRAAGFENDVCNAAENQIGGDYQARGRFVPPEVMTRVLSVGTATDGAELVAANLLAGSYVEVLRNNMVVLQAGATMLPGLVGTVEIPRQTSGNASTWVSAEDGDATVSDPQFDQITMAPKDLASYTEVTRRLLMQSTPAIEGIVRNDMAIAQALGIDAAAFYGTGSSGQPTGITAASGINTLDFAAAAPTYAETVNMVTQTITSNALFGSLAYVISGASWEDAMITTKDSGSGQFIMATDGTINSYQALVSTQVTAEDWIFGNWADLLIGEWGGLEINVDPFTHSLKGKIRFVTFKTVDLAVRHPESFIWANDAQ